MSNRIALCIGIDHYGAPNTLPGSARSARGFAGLLRPRGFHLSELYDASASKAAIVHALGQCYAACQAPGDVLAVYYCGHGLPVGGEDCIAPIDVFPASGGTYLENCIPASQWQTLLAQRPAHAHVFTLLDCCYSAGIAAQHARAAGRFPLVAQVPDSAQIAFAGAGSQFTPVPIPAGFAQPAIANLSNLAEYAPCGPSQLTVQLAYGTGGDYYSVFTYWLLKQMQQPLASHWAYKQMFTEVATLSRKQYALGVPVLKGDTAMQNKIFLS